MKKNINFILAGLCVAVFATSTPALASAANSNYIDSVSMHSDLIQSINALNRNSSSEEIDDVMEMLNNWNTTDIENTDNTNVPGNAGAIMLPSGEFQSTIPVANAVSPYSGTMYDSMNQNDSSSVSLNMMFAKLQLAMSETTKNHAIDYMKRIETLQDSQKILSLLCNDLSQIYNTFGNTSTIALPSDMKITLVEQHVCPNNYPLLMKAEVSKEDLQCLLQMTQMKLEETGENTQNLMVYLQDYVGQYNSYIETSHQQIAQANQTLASISRGQTMFGEGNSLLFTSILLGAGAGVVGTLLTQKAMKKRKKQ